MQSQDMYELIDLDRYPLNDLDSEAGLQLVAETRLSLDQREVNHVGN